MKKQINKYVSIFLLIFISNCGFKVMDKTQGNDFSIKEINLTGNRQINYEIKNNLIYQFKNESKNILIINLDSKKIKSIKEKNINNKIVKYEVDILINGNLNLIEQNIKEKISFKVTGDYKVADNFSTTLSNEKNLNKALAQETVDKILNKIRIKLNDI